MKLEILKKLVALANNNPNDHEANTAARRVCKALTEDKFIDQLTEPITRTPTPDFKSTPPKPTNQSAYSTYSNPFGGSSWDDIFGDRFRNAAYGGAAGAGRKGEDRRKSEPPPKSRGVSEELAERGKLWSYEYYNQVTRSYYNPVTKKNYSQIFQDQWYEETGFRHSSDTKEFRSGANYGNPNTERPKYKPYTGAQEDFFNKSQYSGVDRKLKCKTCGQIFNTKFVGHALSYECNECQWTAYAKSNETKKSPKESPKQEEPSKKCERCKTPVSCITYGYCTLTGVNI